MKKQSLVRIFTLLVVCLTCLVAYTSAWFSLQYYDGNAARYDKTILITSTQIQISNFYMDKNLTYVEINNSEFSVTGLYPNSGQTFKTVLTNNQNTTLSVSLYLKDLVYSPELNNFLYIKVSTPTTSEDCYKDFSVECVKTIDGEDVTMNKLATVSLVKNVSIAPSASVTVVWQVFFNANADDTCQGALVFFDKLLISLA